MILNLITEAIQLIYGHKNRTPMTPFKLHNFALAFKHQDTSHTQPHLPIAPIADTIIIVYIIGVEPPIILTVSMENTCMPAVASTSHIRGSIWELHK